MTKTHTKTNDTAIMTGTMEIPPLANVANELYVFAMLRARTRPFFSGVIEMKSRW
jgi:hypothetical protein